MIQLTCRHFAILFATVFFLMSAQSAQAEMIFTPSAAAGIIDNDGDGTGDGNAVAGLISAGIRRRTSVIGDGTLRTHYEWDISSLSPEDVGSARIEIFYFRGSVDKLDTQFYAGTAAQDGMVTNDDYQAPATLVPNSLLPATIVDRGRSGTFVFDVTSFVKNAVVQGFEHFSIQGRVDESLPGSARGIQTAATFYVPEERLARLVVSPTVASVPVPAEASFVYCALLVLGGGIYGCMRRRGEALAAA